MRVVHVVTLVSDDGAFGGPTSVALGQLQEFAARGHTVTLLSLWRGRSRAPARIGSVPLRSRPARSLIPGQGFLGLMHPLLVRDIWRATKDADVVHIHAGRDLVSLTALVLAVLRRKRFIVQTHGMVEPRHTTAARLFDRAYMPLLRRARGCLVLTEVEGRALVEAVGPDGPPLLPLPNGVRPPTGREEWEPRGREVLFLARLHPRKRPEAFVEMAALVHKEVADARFKLHGSDEGLLPVLRELIAARGLEKVVSYGGALEPAAAVRAYAKASVYVLPSVNEPFPMTVLEALAAGTPVVCTDSCAIAGELARRGAAIVTDGSPEAMADAVCDLLGDEDLRRSLAEAGRRAVEEVFSIRAVGDRLEEIYQKEIS
ncbi:glycosyltransferase [Streptomyces sp. A3M-1-3]|uniref:glycosyltransferase n=1 Tax=Streptomyces sp. A3M-1-3 TaxID=2962044 RepID=UPI0020B748B0|nr:glycosyltransferase [Streptomyces sp. A3M-1-3]MCP3819735.1 glycosyltransferase [Streptomyces sp. A3M-1-3]